MVRSKEMGGQTFWSSDVNNPISYTEEGRWAILMDEEVNKLESPKICCSVTVLNTFSI